MSAGPRTPLWLLLLPLLPLERRVALRYDATPLNSYFTQTSSYLNLGYWEPDTSTLDEACQAMAELLADRTGLRPQDDVLDVGFGFGDQDLYWAERFAVRRLSGVNLSARQVEVARRRIAQAGLAHRVDLREGSATALPFAPGSFDKVLALESAHHFASRERFFREAHRVLRPGGRLGIADVVSRSPPPPGWLARARQSWLRALLTLAPADNVYPIETYVHKLGAAGFEAIDVLSIGARVYEPFLRYVARQLADPGAAARVHPLFRWVWRRNLASFSRHGLDPLEDYVIVIATRTSATPPRAEAATLEVT